MRNLLLLWFGMKSRWYRQQYLFHKRAWMFFQKAEEHNIKKMLEYKRLSLGRTMKEEEGGG